MKKKILNTWISLFFLWPMLHHYFVIKYQINPWKFGGWAMFCQDKIDYQLSIFYTNDLHERKNLISLLSDHQKNKIRYLIEKSVLEFMTWGLLGKFDFLINYIFSEFPDLTEITITINHTYFRYINGLKFYKIKRDNANLIRI